MLILGDGDFEVASGDFPPDTKGKRNEKSGTVGLSPSCELCIARIVVHFAAGPRGNGDSERSVAPGYYSGEGEDDIECAMADRYHCVCISIRELSL